MRVVIFGLLISLVVGANSLTQEASPTGAVLELAANSVALKAPPEYRYRGCGRREDTSQQA